MSGLGVFAPAQFPQPMNPVMAGVEPVIVVKRGLGVFVPGQFPQPMNPVTVRRGMAGLGCPGSCGCSGTGGGSGTGMGMGMDTIPEWGWLLIGAVIAGAVSGVMSRR